MTWFWGVVAAIALLWPDRISGPLDGVPLDRVPEAIAIGAILPALWALHPPFLRTSFARGSIVALLVWKAFASTLLVQDGWCVRFDPMRPYAKDAVGAPHSWDLRADWRAAEPACSAVMTRSYHNLHEFPVWFFNLPPASDSWPAAQDRPPGATIAMRVRGFLHTNDAGRLQIDTGPDIRASTQVDGRPIGEGAQVAAGLHIVAIEALLTGERWWLIPRWNGEELWTSVTTTIDHPSRFNLLVRPGIRWIPFVLASTLLLTWLASAIARVGDVPVLAWSAGASLVIGWLTINNRFDLAPWAITALTLAVFIPVPPRLRNLSGAFVLVGVPWIAFVLACSARAVGRWVLYEVGHDYWMYQRFAYRIVMQGYWLEGGSPTFWFQPFYRWIVGILHVVFGDSSVGEWYWDGACLLAGGLLSFRIARTFAGFRWGIAAAVTSLAVFVLGNAWHLIGQGLSEISSAGLLSLAALCAIRSRNRSVAAAIAAGVLATLAFYTRLNNLIMALGVAVFALPLRLPLGELVRPRTWWRRISWRTALIVPVTIALGLAFFAWRTWYYTGVFSVFHGTQRYVVAIWQPGAPLRTVLERLTHSVMVVLTVNDPPRFDVFALPVLGGAAVAVLSLAGVPRFRRIPAAAVLFFFASIGGAFVAYGWTYTGRFSVHVMPITSALAICGLASLFRRDQTKKL